MENNQFNPFNHTIGIEIECQVNTAFIISEAFKAIGQQKEYTAFHYESGQVGESALPPINLLDFQEVLEASAVVGVALPRHIPGGYDMWAGSAHLHLSLQTGTWEHLTYEAFREETGDDVSYSEWEDRELNQKLDKFQDELSQPEYAALCLPFMTKGYLGYDDMYFRDSQYQLFRFPDWIIERDSRNLFIKQNNWNTMEFRLNEAPPLWIYILLWAKYKQPTKLLEELTKLWEPWQGFKLSDQYNRVGYLKFAAWQDKILTKIYHLVVEWFTSQLPEMAKYFPKEQQELFLTRMQQYLNRDRNTLSYIEESDSFYKKLAGIIYNSRLGKSYVEIEDITYDLERCINDYDIPHSTIKEMLGRLYSLTE